MTAPAFTRREAQSIDALMGMLGPGWDGLEERLPETMPKPMQPGEDVAKFVYGLSRTPQGRAMLEWMMDITFRAPFRATGKSFEETALLAATRQGIEGVGEVILAAIEHGARLIEQDKADGESS